MARIYFDNAATTPLDKKVIKAMADFEGKYYGNPNSVHREGQQARAAIDFARAAIAGLFSAKPQEIVFTSGATEANNQAIRGVASSYIRRYKFKPHIITTALEHQSVYNVIKELQANDIIDASFVMPDRNGTIQAADIIKQVTEHTALISVIFVSNEIGTVNPVREVGRLLREVNSRQKHQILLHTDAVQAVKYQNCHVQKLGVDLLTFSGHKINGPKGIGGLYVRAGTELEPLLSGGSQEYGLRAGTQNTVGIIGMAKAFELLGPLDKRLEAGDKLRELSKPLIEWIKQTENCDLNGPEGASRNPDNVNFTIFGADQETVIAKLDLAGFAVSTGSACVSGASEPSHVIRSLGKINDIPAATVRVTLGKQNTGKELSQFIKILSKLV